MPLTLDRLRGFLDAFLCADRFTEDQNGVYLPFERPIHTLGLALGPWPGLASWVQMHNVDALFLHRPWGLAGLPKGVGVLAYHYAFDERLTAGYNPRLADALLMSSPEVLGYKEARPLGMIGDVPATSAADFREVVEEVFGGLEGVYGHFGGEVTRACVVGAMRPELVREAAVRGATVYLTGQYRKGAAKAVAETGMTILEIGHARSERWGLRALAGVLRERFSGLTVVLSPHAFEPSGTRRAG